MIIGVWQGKRRPHTVAAGRGPSRHRAVSAHPRLRAELSPPPPATLPPWRPGALAGGQGVVGGGARRGPVPGDGRPARCSLRVPASVRGSGRFSLPPPRRADTGRDERCAPCGPALGGGMSGPGTDETPQDRTGDPRWPPTPPAPPPTTSP